MNALINGSLYKKIRRVRESKKPIEIFKINYKPIFRIIRHLNGAVTIAISKWRIKIWGWWK